MIDCPKCTAPLADAAICCNGCGWVKPGTAKPSAGTGASPLLDPLRHNCVHEDRGQRCVEWGGLSESTNGGGKRYCQGHFPPFQAWRAGGKYVGPTPAFRAVQKSFKRFAAVPDVAALEAEVGRAAIRNEGEPSW